MVLFFHRLSGIAYVCDDTDAPSVESKLRTALGEHFASFEKIPAPIGGGFRVRAIIENHLDVTTFVDRLVL